MRSFALDGACKIGDSMRKMRATLRAIASMGLSAAMVASFCVVAPGAAVAEDANAQVAAEGTAADGTAGTGSNSAPDNVQQSDYTNQYFSDLLSAGRLSVGSNTKLEAADDVQGVFVSGPAGELASTGIGVQKELNFDSGTVSRVRVQALLEKKTKATLACYIDGGSEPIASFKLRSQTKADNWDTAGRDYCVDISALKLTGKHTFSFKLLDATAEQPKVLLKSFELMKFSVPVVDFHIDEDLGSVDAMNASLNHKKECYGNFDLNVPDGYVSEYTGEELQSASYELEYLRGRGNSTWLVDSTHKPYKVKLDKKADLLGMGKNKHWTLIANYYDNSQLRNKITYWLSEQLGFEYSVKLEPVEVIMNGEYYGSYYLCEQVRVDKNRINIDDLDDTPDATDEETISGGYLLNLNESTEEGHGFATNNYNISWSIESPSLEGAGSQAQYNYIKNYVEATEQALYSDSFCDADGKRYTEYLDLQSAVDYLWVQEFSMNGDAYVGGSNYLYKKRNGKLYFGPLWDFDYVAWGSSQYYSPTTTGWQQKEMWVARLLQDEEFATAFIERWQELKAALEEITRSGGKLDQFAARIVTAVNYNVEKYGMTQMAFDEPAEDDATNEGNATNGANVVAAATEETASVDINLTFAQEVERLRTWIEQRTSWVDQHVDQRMPVKCSTTFVSDGKVLSNRTAYVGAHLEIPSEAPTKKGYTFAGWQLSYHIDYERYLKVNSLTEEELVEKLGAEEAAKIKSDGYDYSAVITENDYNFLVPCDLTFTALFKAESSNSLLGETVTKNGIKYQVTSTSAKTGRSVKVAGISSTKAKKAVIAKSIKINGKSYAVTEVGAKAFAGCKKLKTVIIKGKGLYVRNATFKALPKKAVVKVPSAGIKHYSSIITSRKVAAL